MTARRSATGTFESRGETELNKGISGIRRQGDAAQKSLVRWKLAELLHQRFHGGSRVLIDQSPPQHNNFAQNFRRENAFFLAGSRLSNIHGRKYAPISQLAVE